MSSKSRTISPLKFRKRHSFNGHSNGKLASPIPSFASSTISRSSSVSRCQSSSTKRRAARTSGPIFTSHKMYMSSNSFFCPIWERTNSPTPRSKENVTVSVRFRPLSSMEINKGNELAWYADGETTVRTKLNAATVYAFDRVFGPTMTTRCVYDAAAQHVVRGAMDGINGTVFAYGVTSSGKTYTMHGDQKSPGIIPLAIKSVFSMIEEIPNREFLLRVSYLEIYNEVINDLLNPTGQNLRIREDAQGPYVEGVKEEVVISPAHCLSLIATGEEHRHVGSNNFNLLSSRSHTIFTLTIESSPRESNFSDKEVTLSRLNLIDLAGSESSKTETTGLRQKEGSYINKSLLTLGTVISKLIDGKSTHVPYRDSKLTRLLQPSLSGHGRVSLICTVTPASTTSEETHNTLKFAHRAKQVEIRCCPNKIIDEKSLIKKYQKEIQCLKKELEQLKRSMMDKFCLMANHEDFATIKQQLEAGQVRLQSRLDEEEQAKAALLDRIQRLTKLILVSTKNTASQTHIERQIHRRRHSFGPEELAYLLNRRREFNLDEEGCHTFELSLDGGNDGIYGETTCNEEDESQRKSLWPWFKLKKNEPGTPIAHLDSDNSSNASSITGGSQVDSNFDGSQNAMADEAFCTQYLGCPQSGELCRTTVQGREQPPVLQIKKLELERDRLRQENDLLQIRCAQVAEEASCAKELASAAAMELKNLAQEVTNLSLQNTKLASELACAQQLADTRAGSKFVVGAFEKHGANSWNSEDMMMDELKGELLESIETDASRDVLLAEKEVNETDIRPKVDELMTREVRLEKERGERYMPVSKLKKEPINDSDSAAAIDARDLSGLSDESLQTICAGDRHMKRMKKIPSMDFKALDECLGEDGHCSPELQSLVVQLKSEDLEGLDLVALDDLSALHAEALARLSHAKARVQEKLGMSSSRYFQTTTKQCEEWIANLCRICSAVHASAVVLPCRHLPLCRSCFARCTECPLCRSTIQDRIIINAL